MPPSKAVLLVDISPFATASSLTSSLVIDSILLSCTRTLRQLYTKCQGAPFEWCFQLFDSRAGGVGKTPMQLLSSSRSSKEKRRGGGGQRFRQLDAGSLRALSQACTRAAKIMSRAIQSNGEPPPSFEGHDKSSRMLLIRSIEEVFRSEDRTRQYIVLCMRCPRTAEELEKFSSEGDYSSVKKEGEKGKDTSAAKVEKSFQSLNANLKQRNSSLIWTELLTPGLCSVISACNTCTEGLRTIEKSLSGLGVGESIFIPWQTLTFGPALLPADVIRVCEPAKKNRRMSTAASVGDEKSPGKLVLVPISNGGGVKAEQPIDLSDEPLQLLGFVPHSEVDTTMCTGPLNMIIYTGTGDSSGWRMLLNTLIEAKSCGLVKKNGEMCKTSFLMPLTSSTALIWDTRDDIKSYVGETLSGETFVGETFGEGTNVPEVEYGLADMHTLGLWAKGKGAVIRSIPCVLRNACHGIVDRCVRAAKNAQSRLESVQLSERSGSGASGMDDKTDCMSQISSSSCPSHTIMEDAPWEDNTMSMQASFHARVGNNRWGCTDTEGEYSSDGAFFRRQARGLSTDNSNASLTVPFGSDSSEYGPPRTSCGAQLPLPYLLETDSAFRNLAKASLHPDLIAAATSSCESSESLALRARLDAIVSALPPLPKRVVYTPTSTSVGRATTHTSSSSMRGPTPVPMRDPMLVECTKPDTNIDSTCTSGVSESTDVHMHVRTDIDELLDKYNAAVQGTVPFLEFISMLAKYKVSMKDEKIKANLMTPKAIREKYKEAGTGLDAEKKIREFKVQALLRLGLAANDIESQSTNSDKTHEDTHANTDIIASSQEKKTRKKKKSKREEHAVCDPLDPKSLTEIGKLLECASFHVEGVANTFLDFMYKCILAPYKHILPKTMEEIFSNMEIPLTRVEDNVVPTSTSSSAPVQGEKLQTSSCKPAQMVRPPTTVCVPTHASASALLRPSISVTHVVQQSRNTQIPVDVTTAPVKSDLPVGTAPEKSDKSVLVPEKIVPPKKHIATCVRPMGTGSSSTSGGVLAASLEPEPAVIPIGSKRNRMSPPVSQNKWQVPTKRAKTVLSAGEGKPKTSAKPAPGGIASKPHSGGIPLGRPLLPPTATPAPKRNVGTQEGATSRGRVIPQTPVPGFGGAIPETPFAMGGQIPETPYNVGGQIPETPFALGGQVPETPFALGGQIPETPFGGVPVGPLPNMPAGNAAGVLAGGGEGMGGASVRQLEAELFRLERRKQTPRKCQQKNVAQPSRR